MKTIEGIRLKEINETKSRFFANLSHEFRTPLTLILGLIEKWSGRAGDEEMRKDFAIMHRNAQRLLHLINQLLDLSKLEAGGMKLQAASGNIVPFVKGIAQSFESSAARKKISLDVEAARDEIEVYFDRDKMENIFTNLLSNAFKFTAEGGRVTVQTTLTPSRHPDSVGTSGHPSPLGRGDGGEDYVEIRVADTGIGIPSDQLNKVFDRFYQVDASQTREQEGSGIGLALTKELVELHRGTIEVRSELCKGATFTVRMLLGRTHLSDDEIVETLDVERRMGGVKGREGQIPISPSLPVSPSAPDNGQSNAATSEKDMPLIQIIEDNADVREYLRSCLAPTYRVLETRNGFEGVERAIEMIPDLVISDLMMPTMDGYEVCKRLKHDERTSHIPIILLTAKAATADRIGGLETGADDYLTKPFKARELLARVHNLIEMRRKLRERFSAGQVLKPGEVAVKSVDDVFLQKVIAAVEARMGDETFNVEDLGKEIGMSRYQLHRKLTAVSNLSASDFLRYMRLHRAKELLEKNAATVSEIAYTVGFGSVPYFTKCFREQFGVTPGEARGDRHLA